MDLILWRHAEAEDAFPDLSRALTPHGREQAALVAAWLKKHVSPTPRVLASPATRTQQTAQALDMEYSTVDALAPGAQPHAVLQAANWPKGEDAVIVIGHQPTLGMAAALAMTGKIHYWSIRKGNVWWLNSRRRAGEDQSLLRAVISPDFL